MHVVMHNAASVDGRIDGFVPDIGLYYSLTKAWDVDAHLVGADTLIEGEQGTDVPIEGEATPNELSNQPADPDSPLLVVTDSRGRVSGWDDISTQSFWRDVLVFCSETTPEDYLSSLDDHDVSYVISGEDHVDLGAAMDELASRDIEGVLVDSGGTLNGALLWNGLIDEVSVLVHPVAVGGTTPRSFIRGPDPQDSPTRLELMAVEQPTDDIVWLRYKVVE